MAYLGQAKEAINMETLRNKTSNWGFFHEIGHNHQKGSWTMLDANEATISIFGMFVRNTVLGISMDEEIRPGK